MESFKNRVWNLLKTEYGIFKKQSMESFKNRVWNLSKTDYGIFQKQMLCKLKMLNFFVCMQQPIA